MKLGNKNGEGGRMDNYFIFGVKFRYLLLPASDDHDDDDYVEIASDREGERETQKELRPDWLAC